MAENSETDDAEISSNHEQIFLEETKQLLNIFPEDIWILVLDQLTNPDDLENCSNSTPYFSHLLDDRRVKFLFPKVLENLLPCYFKNKESNTTESQLLVAAVQDGSNTVLESRNEVNSIYKLNILLKLRLVCPAWNNAVEKFLQGQTTGNLTLDYDLKHGEMLANRHQANFSLDQYHRPPTLFLEHFQKTHYSVDLSAPIKNPFTGRSLQFSLFFGSHLFRTEFLEAISSLLFKFGAEVWYYSLDVEASSEMQLEFYLLLKKWLELMPNLKLFEICYSRTQNLNEDAMNTMELQNLLVDGITDNPLPNLKRLQLLKVKHLPAIMFKELLKKNLQISGLDLKVEAGDIRGNGYDIYSVPLPNLKLLSTTNNQVPRFQELNESIVSNWALERFYFLCSHSTDFFECFQVFNLLRFKWADTLTDLAIQLPYPSTDAHKRILLEQTKSIRLNLPNLHRLNLSVTEPICLDFLLSCDSLEHIEVVAYYCPEHVEDSSKSEYYDHLKRKQIVEYLGFEHRMLESNIWNIFGRLKKFSISVWDYDEGFISTVYYRSNLSPSIES